MNRVPTVIFLHGKESGPWGNKIRLLARVAERHGCRVVSRDDEGILDPEERVERLLASHAEDDGPMILAGSSMGGYVAAVGAARLAPMGVFLMAPAVGLPGYKVDAPVVDSGCFEVVHGWDDDVIPLENVLTFVRNYRGILSLVPAGHALQEQLDWLEQAFDAFLGRCLTRSDMNGRGRVLASF